MLKYKLTKSEELFTDECVYSLGKLKIPLTVVFFVSN